MTDYGITIHQGYVLPEGVDLFDLCARLRTAMAPVHRAIQVREIAQQAAMILDRADLQGEPRPESVAFGDTTIGRRTACMHKTARRAPNGAPKRPNPGSPPPRWGRGGRG